jgi:hypothetical protein
MGRRTNVNRRRLVNLRDRAAQVKSSPLPSQLLKNASNSSEDSEGLGNEESVSLEIRKKCEQILMGASAALPLRVARGEIPGYKVNYGAPLGRPSERTIYRKRKLEMQASEIREKRDAAFRHNQGQKTLLTHFFSSTSHAQETSRDVETRGAEQLDTSTAASGRESPTQSAVGSALVESDLESASNSIAGDSEIDEVIQRFPDADAERLSDVRSTPIRFCRPPTSEQASAAAMALLEVMQTRRGSGHKRQVEVVLSQAAAVVSRLHR